MDIHIVNKLLEYVVYNYKWWDTLKGLVGDRVAFHKKAKNYLVAASRELKIKSTEQERDEAAIQIWSGMVRKHHLY